MSLRNLLTQTVTIQSLSTSKTVMGGSNKTYTTRLNAIPALINSRLSGGEIDTYGKISTATTHRMYLESTSNNREIAASDRVIWTSASRTFEITEVYNVGNRNVIMHVDMEEVD